MKRKVCYNGGTESYYPCSDPSKLVEGRKYDLVAVEERGHQTNYVLRGVEGSYNSTWFHDGVPTYIAVSDVAPRVGQYYYCQTIQKGDTKYKLVTTKTSTVQEVIERGGGLYEARTRNSLYIVKVF